MSLRVGFALPLALAGGRCPFGGIGIGDFERRIVTSRREGERAQQGREDNQHGDECVKCGKPFHGDAESGVERSTYWRTSLQGGKKYEFEFHG